MAGGRYFSIDAFRGMAIVAMVIGNTALIFKEGGFWASHAEDYGLTVGDLIAPMFILAIAMTYKMSFDKGVTKEGKLKTYVKFVRRYAALVGIGFIFHPVSPPSDQGILFGWGVLASIGLAGLLTLPFIHLSRWARLAVSVAALTGYHLLLTVDVTLPHEVMSIGQLNWHDGHGGVIGGVGWFAMLLLSTVLLDDPRTESYRRLWLVGLCPLLLGLALHGAWAGYDLANLGISKERVTVAYVLVSVGANVLFFSLLHWIADTRQWFTKSALLTPFARNPFFIFIIHPFFVLGFYLALPEDSGDLVVGLACLANTFLLWKLADWMDDRRYYINF